MIKLLALTLLFLSTATSAGATSCMSWSEARESGKGYPRYTVVNYKRCWYVNRQQLQAIHRDKYKLRLPPPKPAPDAPPPEVQTAATYTQIRDQTRLVESFEEIADLMTWDNRPRIKPPESSGRITIVYFLGAIGAAFGFALFIWKEIDRRARIGAIRRRTRLQINGGSIRSY